ncbi:MAG: hypothetical protein RL705_1806 [Bacteroidota bacterium]|jgi:hypothetical protein
MYRIKPQFELQIEVFLVLLPLELNALNRKKYS